MLLYLLLGLNLMCSIWIIIRLEKPVRQNDRRWIAAQVEFAQGIIDTIKGGDHLKPN